MADHDTALMAALAGLLHDIGKFIWRAKFNELQQTEQKPDASGAYGYWHSLASHRFITEHVAEELRDQLTGVSYHHHPDSNIISKNDAQPWQVRLADLLASSEPEKDEDDLAPQMRSIFCKLHGYEGEQYYLPLVRLNPRENDSLFPKPAQNTWNSEYARLYKKLWDDFENACNHLELKNIADPEKYLETIYALLQEFTWSIPTSSDPSMMDVSLFDHLRTTSAIAACLAAEGISDMGNEDPPRSESAVCLLVVGDLSNLQNFIYTLASEGAAKSLRARSFYVQMLCEAIALNLLRALHLPITNIIYIGGGGFQLLAPLGKAEELKKIAGDITDRLIELHQGALGITIHWEKITAQDFRQFNIAYDRMGKVLNQAKRRPFASASADKLAQMIGEPITMGGDPLRFCMVTGEDGENLVQYEDNPNQFKSKFVDSLEELGKILPRATHIAVQRVEMETPGRATGWQQALRMFGLETQIIMDGQKANFMPNSALIRVWRLEPLARNDERDRLADLGTHRVVSYRPFAKLTPLKANIAPKTFDELAEPMRGAFRRWGVLRMDVDNLGQLFQKGFGASASLSRIASLSFALRLFFESWLPQLALPQKDDPMSTQDLSKFLYLQYSGGDDLFIVGAWDALPEFARRVRRSFSEYTAHNPNITLSAGMTVVDEKFPLYQAAEQAGAAEHAAKSPRPDGKEKDAFTFLGQTLSWQELEDVKTRAYDLADLIDAGKVPNALPQTLLVLHHQVQRARTDARRHRHPKPQYGRWTWMAAYQLTRMIAKTKDDGAKGKIQILREAFRTYNQEIDAIALAARWAQYLTRGG
jgi:CRISPR-associated protein Csm1